MLEKWAMIILIGIALFGIGFTRGCAYQVKEHDLFVAKMEADSEKLLAHVLQRNALLKAKYDADAKKKDEDYVKKLDRIRAAGKSGSVFHSCESGGNSTAAGANGAGTSEAAASREGVVPAPRSVALGQPEVATVMEWYVYGESCNAWVNFGERK